MARDDYSAGNADDKRTATDPCVRGNTSGSGMSGKTMPMPDSTTKHPEPVGRPKNRNEA
jgi:hypothetical protein